MYDSPSPRVPENQTLASILSWPLLPSWALYPPAVYSSPLMTMVSTLDILTSMLLGFPLSRARLLCAPHPRAGGQFPHPNPGLPDTVEAISISAVLCLRRRNLGRCYCPPVNPGISSISQSAGLPSAQKQILGFNIPVFLRQGRAWMDSPPPPQAKLLACHPLFRQQYLPLPHSSSQPFLGIPPKCLKRLTPETPPVKRAS